MSCFLIMRNSEKRVCVWSECHDRSVSIVYVVRHAGTLCTYANSLLLLSRVHMLDVCCVHSATGSRWSSDCADRTANSKLMELDFFHHSANSRLASDFVIRLSFCIVFVSKSVRFLRTRCATVVVTECQVTANCLMWELIFTTLNTNLHVHFREMVFDNWVNL